MSDSIQQLLASGHRLQSSGKLGEAESHYRQALKQQVECKEALEALTMLYLGSKRPDAAVDCLQRLVQFDPDNALYTDRLATLLDRLGNKDAAIACYHQLLTRQAGLSSIRFNLARLLKRHGALQEALDEYQLALGSGIDCPEEVYSNISVIYCELHRGQDAIEALQKSLAINPRYVPAMYNLGLRYEESGNRDAALALFRQILTIDADHSDALVRIAHAQKTRHGSDPLIDKLKRALYQQDLDPQSRENLHFALGKTYDDCGQYPQAFEQYQHGNQCARQRVKAYDPVVCAARFKSIKQQCNSAWVADVEAVSEQPLIFITGMFRSGSTLLEQVLAGHPAVTAGGEIDYFRRHIEAFPESLQCPGSKHLRELGRGYLDYLAQTFPGSSLVTNKRPDNFVYLGLIKALFPRARFIDTVRNPLDVCLSIYFQQFDSELNYATELQDIGDYYLHYRDLMRHWQQCFGADIWALEYERLVDQPEPTIRELLAFLDLPWDAACLDFHQRDNRVSTASVWQVRQPLYAASSGRWRNYAPQLAALRQTLDARAQS